jgi:hypothetical protein
MTGVPRTPLARFAAFALLAIVVPAVILAILGYHSLRQWRRSADELFREQSRSMAVMVAEKVDLALRNAEYGIMGRLEAATRGGAVVHDGIEALLADTPLIARLARRQGRPRCTRRRPTAGTGSHRITGGPRADGLA